MKFQVGDVVKIIKGNPGLQGMNGIVDNFLLPGDTTLYRVEVYPNQRVFYWLKECELMLVRPKAFATGSGVYTVPKDSDWIEYVPTKLNYSGSDPGVAPARPVTLQDAMRAEFEAKKRHYDGIAAEWKAQGKCPSCGELGRYHLSTPICSKHGAY